MTWFMAGAAAVSAGTSLIGAQSAANASARAAGRASLAEGEAIAKERLNTTIRNSYSAALAQMNLSLKKLKNQRDYLNNLSVLYFILWLKTQEVYIAMFE
jgi:hypothetical protein